MLFYKNRRRRLIKGAGGSAKGMTHSGSLCCRYEHSASHRTADKTRIIRGYIPALIDLAVVCPTEGVKTGAMDLLRTLPSRRVDGPARIRVRRGTPLSPAQLKFHAALRSSRFPFSLPFFSFFFFHTLGSVIGPSVLLLLVRSSRVRSPELSSRRSCSHASLNPFPRFSLSLLRTSMRFALPFHFHFGVPTSRFSGRDIIVPTKPLSPLDFKGTILRIFTHERILDPHGKLHERRAVQILRSSINL